MSLPLTSVYCKHWIENTNIKFENFKYQTFTIKPHKTINIKESIHYKALLTTDYTNYESLIHKTKQLEHSKTKFINLLSNFNIVYMDKIKLYYSSTINKYIINDGLHRISILLYKNIIKDNIPLNLLDIEYDLESQNKIKQLMISTTKYSQYNGWNNRLPYQTITMGKEKLIGQRDVEIRLNKIKLHINFDNKTVVDFGCNLGGNFFQLPEIKNGFGCDYDSVCVNAATEISKIFQYNSNLIFFIHDFDKDSYTTLLNKINIKPDIIFLTSMGSWVKNWVRLYTMCLSYNCDIIFETNNDTEGKPQLDFFKSQDIKLISDNSDDDCTGNNNRKLYLIKHISKKVYISGPYHHKNDFSLRKAIDILGWTITNFEEATIILSPSKYYDITKYPNKKFIFGNHFSVFPNDIVRKFNNMHNNAIYIQPSQQSVTSWVDEFEFSNLPMKIYPFGVDTEKFKPYFRPKTNVFIYYKYRKPKEYEFIRSFLSSKNIDFTTFKYGEYEQGSYISFLNKSKYGIWIGCHESQGFALQEALSMNVPLLVWNVSLRTQQYGAEEVYKNVKSKVTTIPYWDSNCGMFFYNKEDFDSTFNSFIQNIDSYNPRKYILENLTIDKRAHALKILVDNI
jgi:hypothetical protein